jgi:hypothetical protein
MADPTAADAAVGLVAHAIDPALPGEAEEMDEADELLDEPDAGLEAQMNASAQNAQILHALTQLQSAVENISTRLIVLETTKQTTPAASNQQPPRDEQQDDPNEGAAPMEEGDGPAADAIGAVTPAQEVSAAMAAALKPKPYYGDGKDPPLASWLAGMHLWLTRMKLSSSDVVQATVNNTAGPAANYLHLKRAQIDAMRPAERWPHITTLMTSRFGPQTHCLEQVRRNIIDAKRPANIPPMAWIEGLQEQMSLLTKATEIPPLEFSRVIMNGMKDNALIQAALLRLPLDVDNKPDFSDPDRLGMAIASVLDHSGTDTARLAWQQVPPSVKAARGFGSGSINPNATGTTHKQAVPHPRFQPGASHTARAGDKRTHEGDKAAARINKIKAELEAANLNYVPPEQMQAWKRLELCMLCGEKPVYNHHYHCTNMSDAQRDDFATKQQAKLFAISSRGRGNSWGNSRGRGRGRNSNPMAFHPPHYNPTNYYG